MNEDVHNSWRLCLVLCFKYFSVLMIIVHAFHVWAADKGWRLLYVFILKVHLIFPVPSRPMVFPPKRPSVLSLLFLGWEKLIRCSLGERPGPSDPIKQCIHPCCLSPLSIQLIIPLYHCLYRLAFIVSWNYKHALQLWLILFSFSRSISDSPIISFPNHLKSEES